MTAVLLPADAIADDRWDAFVAGHARGHFLQSAAWGRLRAAQGWQVVRTALRDERGALVAGAQALVRRRLGGAVAYVPRGPVVEPGSDAWPALLAALRARHRPSTVALRLEPHWTDDAAGRAGLDRAGLRVAEPLQPPSTLVLDLTRGPEALLAAMKPKWRYNIGLAARSGVEVGRGGDGDLDAFETLLSATARRHGLGARPAGYHAAVAAALGPAARLFVARAAGEVLAAALVVHHGRTATYLYGASSEAQRQRMPSHAVQWAAITDAAAAGLAAYDFWGVPDAVGRAWAAGGDPDAVPPGEGGLWGVWRFKRGFGGAVWRAVGAADDVYAPLRYAAGAWLERRRAGHG